jgi:hypothetical protein
VGCGSGGGPLNRSQLAAKANSICAGTNSTLKKVGQPANDATSYARFLKADIAALKTEGDQVNALNPASDVKAQRDAYVKYESDTITVLQKAYDAARRGNLAGVTAQLKLTAQPGTATLATARELGWTTCTKAG